MRAWRDGKGTSGGNKRKFRPRGEAGVELRGMWKIMQKGERKGDVSA